MKLSIAAVVSPRTSRANKTGAWRSFRPVMNDGSCNSCGLCEAYCPDGVIRLSYASYCIEYDYCKGCGICAHECPTGAITMVVEEK